MQVSKTELVKQLRRDILSVQRMKRDPEQSLYKGLQEIEQSFPDQCIPRGVVHEFISHTPENAAATNAFIAGLAAPLMSRGQYVLWINGRKSIFPPALLHYGISPEKIIFIDPLQKRDILWTIEEGMKCDAIAAVIGELCDLSFTESRRLQLTAEQSRVTAFIHRLNPRSENTVTCVTRWKISQLHSDAEGLPGVGYARWNVQLQKVRNGQPGTWQLEWVAGAFRPVKEKMLSAETFKRKTG